MEEFPVCECEAKKRCKCSVEKKMMEITGRNRLIDFLMGLNPMKYHGVIGNILAMEPLPSVSKAFHLVQQAEKHKEIHEENFSMNVNDMSALNAKRQGGSGWQKRESKKEKYSKVCEHCGMRGHTRDECFKIHGYPDWFKKLKGKNKGKMAANVSKHGAEDEEETPLELKDGEQNQGVKADSNLISSVVQEVVKVLNDKQAGGVQSCKFAGPLY